MNVSTQKIAHVAHDSSIELTDSRTKFAVANLLNELRDIIGDCLEGAHFAGIVIEHEEKPPVVTLLLKDHDPVIEEEADETSEEYIREPAPIAPALRSHFGGPLGHDFVYYTIIR